MRNKNSNDTFGAHLTESAEHTFGALASKSLEDILKMQIYIIGKCERL